MDEGRGSEGRDKYPPTLTPPDRPTVGRVGGRVRGVGLGREGWWGNGEVIPFPTSPSTILIPSLSTHNLLPPTRFLDQIQGWKVDRVLANQSLLLTAGTPSNIPFAWFLVLACNRQAWVSGGVEESERGTSEGRW